ncbi:hypothetical protein MRS44_000114 [Fusarium solani]|uniref:uncharacterized protein n=1 Tax=Fusarium solani TaxID=169388 RepID=UPI0032C4B168|nr:hypothetical protein MRS44_000114 [Fusarium solani]
MVIGLLAITAIPTVTGVGNAISAQKKQNANLSKEQEKFHMTFIMEHEGKVQELGTGVVKDQKFYINFPDNPVDGYKFLGWYFKYPSEEGHLGLVSMVSDDPPALNWIYVDKDTHAVTEDDRFLTLEGDHDSFVAVREEGPDGEQRWAVYWDPEGDIEDEVDDEDRCRPEARQGIVMYILYLDSNLDHDLMAVPNPVIRPGGLNLYGLAPLGRRVDIDKRTTINSYQFQFSHYSSDLNKNRPKHNPIMSATMEKDRVSAESDDQTYSSEEQPKKQRRTKKKGTKTSRRKQQQQQQSGPLDQLPVGGDLGNTVGGVTNTLGGVTGGALNQQQGGDDGGKSDTLRLRLDLNLDIEIQLKARIHGDLELALLLTSTPNFLKSIPPVGRHVYAVSHAKPRENEAIRITLH